MNGTVFWSAVFFIALIWFVAWLSFLATRAYMIGEGQKEAQRKQERKRLLAELEKEFYGEEDIPKRPKATQKRAVKFVDAEEEAEAESEVDEPKGTYAYDPVAHKVVFTPAQ